ncbi:TPA: helix-turn-helix domain-containing protein [Serratia marcescens]
MLVTMSQKELNRISVLQQACDKHLTQAAAAKLLKLSVRQLQRILARYLADGAAGITSRKRGNLANNRTPDDLKLRVLTLLREKYGDFGPAFATEKLRERHQISISVETVRHCMITDGLWN